MSGNNDHKRNVEVIMLKSFEDKYQGYQESRNFVEIVIGRFLTDR